MNFWGDLRVVFWSWYKPDWKSKNPMSMIFVASFPHLDLLIILRSCGVNIPAILTYGAELHPITVFSRNNDIFRGHKKLQILFFCEISY